MDNADKPGTSHVQLVCSNCGQTYTSGPKEPWRCECGSALNFDYHPQVEQTPPSFLDIDTRDGLWAFEALFPISKQVSLGEGFTPLVNALSWDAQFKLEYVSPSGSFKDRGAVTMLSRACELGIETVLDDSSGNAGSAVAMYAAQAGVDAKIFVPENVKEAKIAAIERMGADSIRVSGNREDVTRACVEAVERGEGWYASHAWNPSFYSGTMTFAYEVAAQRNWDVPDAVVLPLGHGTLFLGAYRGFKLLREAGWIDKLPQLLGAQAAGYDPIATELHGKTHGENDLADGIQIQEPARSTEILNAIEVTDGDAISIGEDAVRAELDQLHRNGFYTEPTCAVAPAALNAYREKGVVADDTDVVIPLTGSGLKSARV